LDNQWNEKEGDWDWNVIYKTTLETIIKLKLYKRPKVSKRELNRIAKEKAEQEKLKAKAEKEAAKAAAIKAKEDAKLAKLKAKEDKVKAKTKTTRKTKA
jgi:wyosine [tRNA(Phe)-imidazoG37] synthetase (radical SAM superfamily)